MLNQSLVLGAIILITPRCSLTASEFPTLTMLPVLWSSQYMSNHGAHAPLNGSGPVFSDMVPFSLVLFRTRSILGKKHALPPLVFSNIYEFIVITEAWLFSNSLDNGAALFSYSSLRKERQILRG